jgi:arginase family enzyme
MRLRVLNLDSSLLDQPPIAGRLQARQAELVDLCHLGPALRLWATKASFRRFAEVWHSLERSKDPIVTLVGSGDFHHLTACFLESVAEPVTVVHFDNHPDWCRTLPSRHCGSWVNHALALANVSRVMTIGPCSDDLVRPDRKGANLEALSAGRLELFAWRHPPSKVRRAIRSGAGHQAEPGLIRWRNLADEVWPEFLDEMAALIDTEAIWLTLDKDVLPPSAACTNWDQGELPLDHMVEAIRLLAARFRVVGVDICGDYSPARHRNLFKLVEARWDQPSCPHPDAADRNAATSETLLRLLEDVL